MTYSTRQFIIRQRYLMIQDHKERLPVIEIARKYRVSRPTVYRWIKRYECEGLGGLLNRSNRPHTPHPRALKRSLDHWDVFKIHPTSLRISRAAYFLFSPKRASNSRAQKTFLHRLSVASESIFISCNLLTAALALISRPVKNPNDFEIPSW